MWQVVVDIAAKLKEVRIDTLPQACWPVSDRVNELATKAAQLVKAGVKKPFVFVKLVDWLPHWGCEKKNPAAGGALRESTMLLTFAGRHSTFV